MCYRENSLSKTTICRCYADVKRGRTNTEKTRSSQVVQLRWLRPKTRKKILRIILSDPKVKLHEIADILTISNGTVFKVVHENLSMKKLYSKWVPRLLTVEQKQQRIHDWKRCLKLFTRNKKDLLRRYITMNETWIHHFTPESRRASAEWREEGESRPKSVRRHNRQQASSWSLYFGTCTEFCSSTCFRRARRSTATSTLPYWIDWKTQLRRKGLTWQRRNRCFNKLKQVETA